MAPPRRKLQETVEETLIPPDNLRDGQFIARVVKAEGKNLYTVELPSTANLLVELEARFRSTIWLKRGGYVVVDTKTLADRDNKLEGEIVNVIRDEKKWRKEAYWPKQFAKKTSLMAGSDEDISVKGRMPPSDDENED